MAGPLFLSARHGRQRAGRLAASVLAGGALIGSLLVGPPAAAYAAPASPAAGPVPSAPGAVVPVAAAPTPSAAATAEPAAGDSTSAGQSEPPARRGAAARTAPRAGTASATADPAETTCGGPVTFGRVVDCPAFPTGGRHVHTVTTTVDDQVVHGRFIASGAALSATLADSGGTGICSLYLIPMDCRLPKAGTYTVTVEGEADRSPTAGGYLLGVDSWVDPSSCVELRPEAFAVAAPAREEPMPAGSPGRCYRFEQPADAVLKITMQGSNAYVGTVEDRDGKELCRTQGFEQCRLRGPGPYRLYLADWNVDASTMRLTTTRLSDPEGCTALPLTPFGAPDDRTGSIALDPALNACGTFTADAGPHLFAFAPDNVVIWDLYDRAGKEVTCSVQLFGGQCTLPAKGTYTLVLRGFDEARTVRTAIYRLAGTDGCDAVLPTASNAPMVTVQMRSRLQVDCRRLEAERGDRLRVYSAASLWLVNGAGATVCGANAGEATAETGCVLTGAGPYRLVSTGRWNPEAASHSYTLRARVLTDSAGCIPLRPGRYGSPPAGASTTQACRVLVVPTAGRYRVELVDEQHNRVAAQVVDRAGRPVCDTGWCSFPAADRYKLTAKGGTAYATVFLPEAGTPADGCTSVSDDPTATAQDGSLYYAGQYDCLTLPTPAGASLALASRYEIRPADFPNLTVYDAAGEPACELTDLTDGSCVLRGTAPFRAILHRGKPGTGSVTYSVSFVRTAPTPSCPALPAGSFASNAPTAVTIPQTHAVGCFTVPAGEHTAAELFGFAASERLALARLSVYDGAGKLICRTEHGAAHFAVCRLGAGPATVLVDGFGSFTLGRRDVTGTAAGCRPVGSTAVGAPPTTGTLPAAGDVHCHRVTADPADHLMISTRDSLRQSRTVVLDPAGAELCAASTATCQVTGRTGYQVLVSGEGSIVDTSYALTAWKVWTAGGAPEQCQSVPAGAYGFGPFTGTLDANRRAVCVATTRDGDDDHLFAVSNPQAPTEAFAGTRMLAVTAGGPRPCPGAGEGRFTCPSGGATAEPTVFLLIRGDDRTAPAQYRWEATCRNPLCGENTFTATAAAPTALTSGGSRRITLTGTSLHLRDRVRVTPAGQEPVLATVQSVSADRTVLTADVDLTDAAAGPATVEIRSFGAAGEPVVLRDALTISTPAIRSTGAPAVTGRIAVGQTVTATPGAWSTAPTGYAYRWFVNGTAVRAVAPRTAVRGATARTYVVPATALGKRLTVTVTATRPGHLAGRASSAASVPVARGSAPKATKRPTVGGTAKVGRTVKATAGSWSPKPSAYRYEWRVNGKLLPKARGASLKLTASMRNKRVTVTVVAVRTGHADGRALSKAVTVRR